MINILLIALLFVFAVDARAALIESPVASLPTSTVDGATRIVVDGIDDADCTVGGGNRNVICTYANGVWNPGGNPGGASTSPSIQDVLSTGNVSTNSTQAHPATFGNGVYAIEAFGDNTLGAVLRSNPLGDNGWTCWATYECILVDAANQATMWRINPAAGTPHGKYLIQPNYRFLASFPVTLFPRGVASYSEASIVTNQPKGGYLQVTDVDTDAVDFRFVVTGKMAAATTATVRLYGVSNNASPSGNIVLNCAMRANRPGTDTYAAHSTTGEQAITLTPATQNRPVSAVTSAITINGTVAEFAEIEGSCEVNASSTTSAQMTNFFLRAEALVQLLVDSWSD